ncbi:MFS transporter [Parvicella tangerina]|uniref:Multidrug efflux pump Tap n=1 Tax=Parvicella tangerina TaxID=2829795 RepID=A0A916JJJ9_9FLAO|nr:MFS transporter [Parvicella tangerina]CAG5077076.1 Enterobactin exporter EntS [Parvicella tangerina]
MGRFKSKDPYASLREREFKPYVIMRFALVFAWTMQFIVIEWEVYHLTKDPLSLGIIGLMEIIPALSIALFAGHIIDKSEKRKLLMICVFAFSSLSLALVYLTSSYALESFNEQFILYGIYGCVFIGGIVRSFISPTIFALLSLIVPKKLYGNATTWSSSAWQMGSVLGPATAGLAIHQFGVSWSLAIVLFMTLVGLTMLLQISPKPIMNKETSEPIFTSLKKGILFVYRTKELFGAILLDMVAVLFGGAMALLPIYATDILDVGSIGFGVLRAAPAIGSFLTILIMAYIPITRNAGKKLLYAIFGFGLSIILFGWSEWFWLSVFALFMSGVLDGISVVIRSTILQLFTPDEMRGRVASVNSMFVGSSNELGAFESGVTAKLFGPVKAVIGGGILTLLIVLGMGAKLPRLRELHFPEEEE